MEIEKIEPTKYPKNLTLENILDIADNKDEILENIPYSNRFANTKQMLIFDFNKVLKVTTTRTLNLTDTLNKVGYSVCSAEQDYHHKPNGIYRVSAQGNKSLKVVWIEKRAKTLYKQEQEHQRYLKQKENTPNWPF